MEKKLTAAEILEYTKKDIPDTPSIGYKQFEPSGSIEEHVTIQTHLEAAEKLISHKKVQKLGSLSQAHWYPNQKLAEVTHQVGSQWSFMGHNEDKKLCLFPEEALYLLEMGLLELKFNEVPMSIQRGYSVLLAPLTDVTEECYRVYAKLNACGYRVLRHNRQNSLTKYEKTLRVHKAGIKMKINNVPVKRDVHLDDSEIPQTDLKKQKMGSLNDIFPIDTRDKSGSACLKQLQIFTSYHDNEPSRLIVTYDIYLPSDGKNSFKKTCLQLPEARVVVHRGNDPMPDMKEFYRLAQQYQDDVPFIHAIVFPEGVSFYNITSINAPVCD